MNHKIIKKKKKEYWIKSGWAISIGTTILGFILTVVYDSLRGKPILSTIWAILKWIGDLVWTFLNFEIKTWWLLIIIILIFILLFFIKKIFYGSKNYSIDIINGWKWSWELKRSNKDKTWIFSELKIHCPKCDTPMDSYTTIFGGLNFECPRCNYEVKADQSTDPEKIKSIILDNINRKKSKKAKAKKTIFNV